MAPERKLYNGKTKDEMFGSERSILQRQPSWRPQVIRSRVHCRKKRNLHCCTRSSHQTVTGDLKKANKFRWCGRKRFTKLNYNFPTRPIPGEWENGVFYFFCFMCFFKLCPKSATCCRCRWGLWGLEGFARKFKKEATKKYGKEFSSLFLRITALITDAGWLGGWDGIRKKFYLIIS